MQIPRGGIVLASYRISSGEDCRRIWKLPVQKAYYHKDGNWYMPLHEFPGALCDPHGYVLFNTREEYKRSTCLRHGVRLHVKHGISAMSNYQRMSQGN